MLYNIVLVSNQHIKPPSHLPPLEVVTEHWVELPASYSNFPLAFCFVYNNVYISTLLSHFVLLST